MEEREIKQFNEDKRIETDTYKRAKEYVDEWNSYTGSIQFNAGNAPNAPLVQYAGTFPTGAMSIVTVYKPDEFQTGSLVSLLSNNGVNLVLTPYSKVVTTKIYYGASGNTAATLST